MNANQNFTTDELNLMLVLAGNTLSLTTDARAIEKIANFRTHVREVIASEAAATPVRSASWQKGFTLAGQSGWNSAKEAFTFASQEDDAINGKEFHAGWKARRPGRR